MNANTITKEQLMEAVKTANGKRRVRTLDESDVDKFLELLNADKSKSIQVMAEAVSNSYKYPAPSTYIRYNYKSGNIQVGTKKFSVAGGDSGSIDVKKYDYGF